MAAADIRESIFSTVAMLGIRLTVGAIFIAHGIGKFESEGFAGMMQGMGVGYLQIPVALGETLGGILLIIGVMSRWSGATIAAIMMGAIFMIHDYTMLTGDNGIEFQLMLLAACLMVMVAGPGRISLAHIVKKLPRILH